MEAIKTEKLTKYYGKTRGITEVGLTVEKGEFFGFIGPNGAGKSTTIRTLLGLISPTSGSARVLGMDVVKEHEAVLRETGYLPSEAAFYSGMRVKDILKFSAELRRKDCAEEAGLLCERLKLDVTRKADELSYGNRKKAAIVCALQSDPALLILDEPTGGLDPLIQREFFEILAERNRKGTTVFLSSHVLHEVQRSCSRAAVIRDGRIIACGSVEALAKTNAKRVNLRGGFDPQGLDGVKDLVRGENSASFLYGGETKALLKKIYEEDVEDVSITEPDLEEIFMHYYENGEGSL
ncbi:MAG: ABC transporter ATP-binding protein [Clostridia bacterium]|nr:ABC transporter ATP-binding protein [Clostridia bacterium]